MECFYRSLNIQPSSVIRQGLLPPLLASASRQQREAGIVDIWTTRLDILDEDRHWLTSVLSADEAARAGRFYHRRDRDHYVAARGMHRYLLAHYLQGSPARLQFTYDAYGKPHLAATQETAGLRFNLSHADDRAVYAITWNRAIGVDLERLWPLPDVEQLATQFFSAAEVAQLRQVPSEERGRCFFNCWTRKEAYVKALGRGLSIPLDQFDVSLAPGEPARLLRPLEGQHREDWFMRELVLDEGYVGTVVVESRLALPETHQSMIPSPCVAETARLLWLALDQSKKHTSTCGVANTATG